MPRMPQKLPIPNELKEKNDPRTHCRVKKKRTHFKLVTDASDACGESISHASASIQYEFYAIRQLCGEKLSSAICFELLQYYSFFLYFRN